EQAVRGYLGIDGVLLERWRVKLAQAKQALDGHGCSSRSVSAEHVHVRGSRHSADGTDYDSNANNAGNTGGATWLALRPKQLGWQRIQQTTHFLR
ncbi:MAG: hypothetical protein LBP24_01505, partial [Coriobacteriales bacterium]|nr:hypothetical protein [Coriobacteriales bacterium]